jgi:hypothetical protein
MVVPGISTGDVQEDTACGAVVKEEAQGGMILGRLESGSVLLERASTGRLRLITLVLLLLLMGAAVEGCNVKEDSKFMMEVNTREGKL